MGAGRTSADSHTASDSKGSRTPRMPTEQHRWQHPRANLPSELEIRPGNVNTIGCSVLSYTEAGLSTSSRPNPILPLQLEPDHKQPVGAECNPWLSTSWNWSQTLFKWELCNHCMQYKQQEMSLIQEEIGKLIWKGAIAPT